ncbi:AraC family transcriptional regulator [Ferruginibacter sp. HRS2-29]|uniref:helix-turn-helix domain-containing protein n=1 Tax=Ferruginibacter sp. HRS2-29 TaxID=2487334 RepID=UPI0020CD3262|nr:helix-turn-helix domain-containing protein [Ferruginibacter sp. HRS2-29]
MNLKFYTPKNKLLQQLIEGYYFIVDNQKGGTEKYWTFPNNFCIVSINLNSRVLLSENSIKFFPSKKENIHTSVVHRYINPIEIYYKKPIHELTIYFKPLGLNHFVKNIETLFLEKRMAGFSATLANFETEMFKIFAEKDREAQIQQLEKFWLLNFAEKDLEFMRNILKDIESNMKIEAVARKYDMSRKHLNTLFLRHLGKPPGEYQKIYRFRQAISNKSGIRSLTELAYENYFYDQSHLIKDFRALTNSSPKSFFKNVDTHQKNVWLFI